MDSLSESTITKFKHETLPDAANHIRLLEVLDDDYSNTIKVRCRITTWSCDNSPSCHAISYTWGDPESNTTILINDKPFPVRTNCEYVLKQALWHAKSRYYWVDAICIDQENDDEKSKQVVMMGNIYKRADHVLACVGDHMDDSLFLFRNLELFSPFMRKISNRRSLILRLCWRFGFFTTRRFIRVCMNFTNRPYFSRLWVLQELKNARQATLLCERDAVSKHEFYVMLLCPANCISVTHPKSTWKPFSSASRRETTKKEQRLRVYQELKTGTLKMGFSDNIFSIYRPVVLLTNHIEPFELVQLISELQCTIPKDKVYGIISLLDCGGDAPIMPDFTKSEFEIALELLHAIWNTELLQKEDSSGVHLMELCVLTIENFYLHQNFPGVLEALRARAGDPEEKLNEAEIGQKLWEGSLPPAPSLAIGCRVSAHDLAGYAYHDVPFMSWNPPAVQNIKVLLPYWTREGDWVVHMKEDYEESSLILELREEAESSRMRIVGHGCAKPGHLNLVGTTFKLLWGPEDILVCTFVYTSLNWAAELDETWIRVLNTSVCRREPPVSSYAVEISQEAVALRDGQRDVRS